MPLPTLNGHQFYLPSPEAFLLTVYPQTKNRAQSMNFELGKILFLVQNCQTGSFGRKAVKQVGLCGCEGIGNFA
jgi:hypothetical protein